MKRLSKLMMLAGALLTLAACSKKDDTESPYLSVELPYGIGRVAASETDLVVKISTNQTWNIEGSASWITVKPTSGSGSAEVVFSVAVNTTGKTRSQEYSIVAGSKQEQFTIRQTADGVTPEPDPTLDVTPSFTKYAHRFSASIDIPAGYAKAGILVSTDAAAEVGGSGVTEYSTENPSGKLSYTVSNLEAGAVYYVRPFAVNAAGETLYAASRSVTTLADPLSQWSANGGDNATQWNALSGFGMDETLITPTATQKTLEGYVNAASQAYYKLPFSHTRNLIQEVNGQKYMFVYIYVDDEGGIGDAVEANQYGGFAYKMSVTPDYKATFSLSGFVFIHANKWIVRQLGKPTDYITEMWNSDLINKADLEKYLHYFTDHTFQFEWTTPDLPVGNSYSDVEMIPVDAPELAFNYHLRKETEISSNFDLTIHSLDYKRGEDDPGEESEYAKQLGSVANLYNNGSCAYAKVNWADETMTRNATSFTYEAMLWATFSTDGTPVCNNWSKMPAGYSEGLYVLMGVEYGVQIRYWALTGFGFDIETGLKTDRGVWMALIGDGGGDAIWHTTNAVEDWTHQFDEGQYPNKTWFHWAVAYDYEAGVFNSYLDGKLIYTENVGQKVQSILGKREDTSDRDRSSFYIGYGYEPGKRCWPGCVSEVRVWNRALSAAEIGAEGHAVSVDPNTAQGLIGYWKCNEGEGSTLHDYSGHGNHAEVVSATPILWQDAKEVGK